MNGDKERGAVRRASAPPIGKDWEVMPWADAVGINPKIVTKGNATWEEVKPGQESSIKLYNTQSGKYVYLPKNQSKKRTTKR